MSNIADKDLITWLLAESGRTPAQIRDGAGIAWSTVAALQKEPSRIEKMNLNNAIKLTDFAREVYKLEAL